MNTEPLHFFTPGWLLDVTLQTTVLLTLAGGLTLGMRRMAAARRHFILASALMLIPVVMLCSFVAPAWRIPWNAQPAAAVAADEVPKKATETTLDPFAPRQAPTVTLSATAAEAAPPSPLWALLWLAGIGAGTLALGASAWTLRRLRAGSHIVVDPTMQRCFAEEAAALHLELPSSCLRMSAACAVPMTWGLSKKTVLLPVQASAWEEARLRLVLRHELAHIARGDVLVTLLTTLSALLLWPHPLVWLTLRASARAREQACDDLALARSGLSPDDFADELLAAVAGLGSTTRPWLPLALAVSASARSMRGRLSSLVQTGRRRAAYSGLQKLLLLLPAATAAFGLAGLSACRKAVPVADSAVPRQILVRSRFVSIPKDSPVLAEAGLTLDGNKPAGLQSLGILSAEKTEELLHLLAQKKGVELMSAPSVTTKSGTKATVEVTREFIYPTQFDPPKQATQKEPVIPTTPTAFEMKQVGVKMEVLPTLLDDGNLMLEATPEATSFEGFVDYGSPITYEGKVVSQNKIQQPIFYTMKTSTGFMMKPGQSVVFGGLGSPDATPLTSRMPKTKDLIFFIIEASVIESGKTAMAPKATGDVTVAEAAVTVVGQVKRQGVYAFKPGMTVGDLIKEAQGLSDRADAANVELTRGPKHAPRATVLDLPNGNSKALEAGDVVTVPKQLTVTVLGQVKRQGLYVLKPGMTVGDLIKEAQGLNERASGGVTQLKRGFQQTFVDVEKDTAKPLEDGDVLTVPEK
ncbi:MAG: SLBB domain-containing protein [Verrucomicrobia bacterium]|nr:SLBB domain-containing protein [Verrucomicrobiota bacterium]